MIAVLRFNSLSDWKKQYWTMRREKVKYCNIYFYEKHNSQLGVMLYGVDQNRQLMQQVCLSQKLLVRVSFKFLR